MRIINYNDKKCIDTFTKVMKSNNPAWISRIGGSDYDCFAKIYKNKKPKPGYYKKICKYNGFFCKNNLDKTLKNSTDIYFNSLKNSDLVSVGGTNLINTICDQKIIKDKKIYGKTDALFKFNFFEDFYPFFKSFQSWGENKKILIISPFSKTIDFQTKPERINNLLCGFNFPNCKFITYQTPITYNNPESNNSEYFKKKTNKYNNWIELAEKIKNDIKKIDFDIAFISSGIYTMYLGDKIKKMGKKAIYLGGTLNIFFNIYCDRYNKHEKNSYKYLKIQNLRYQIDSIDKFDDLFDYKDVYTKEYESLSAYFRSNHFFQKKK